MRKLVACAALALMLATAAAPLVSADSSAWRPRTANCGTEAGMIDFLVPPSEFVTAFVPFHEANGTRVLTVLAVSVDGATYVNKPLAAKDRERLVTCSYVDSNGWLIEVTGLLKPES